MKTWGGGGGGGGWAHAPGAPQFLHVCIRTLNWDCSTSAILGLTVLALGNCVADWVADTLVARAGKPEMAFASCFGSPLLSHVIGLSVAMIVSSFIAAVIYMSLLHW